MRKVIFISRSWVTIQFWEIHERYSFLEVRAAYIQGNNQEYVRWVMVQGCDNYIHTLSTMAGHKTNINRLG